MTKRRKPSRNMARGKTAGARKQSAPNEPTGDAAAYGGGTLHHLFEQQARQLRQGEDEQATSTRGDGQHGSLHVFDRHR